VRLEPLTSPTGLTEDMTILRRLPPPRPTPLLLLPQALLGPRPDPAPPRLLRLPTRFHPSTAMSK
jgi:hypothetical protein